MDDNQRIFIDTNILIYASLDESPFYKAANDALINLEKQKKELFINRQVLREYLATMTRPSTITKELQRESIIEAIKNFEEDFVVLDERATVTVKLLELVGRIAVSGKQIHDASIVATMLVNNIPELLTHNVSDFKRFQPEIKLTPLLKDD